MTSIKFIDLFAGMGGMRLAFESAAKDLNLFAECVLTSEIKSHAIATLETNFPNNHIHGDIRNLREKDIPDFDVLLAGFPCQAFSYAGKRLGFDDTRGTLFFEVARILKAKQPLGFILENVEGLIRHDIQNPKDKIGRTFETILNVLQDLGYQITWAVLNALDFGVPQARKRVFIVGTKHQAPNLNLDMTNRKPCSLNDILQIDENDVVSNSSFVKKVLSKFKASDLIGKSFNDKRGGVDNIHSWDIGLKGDVTLAEKRVLESLMKERRKRCWAQDSGIPWKDGQALSKNQLERITQLGAQTLNVAIDHLVQLQYIKQDAKRIDAYDLYGGKLSFEFSDVLNPKGYAPTLVATDLEHLAVYTGKGLRSLKVEEMLALCGYPKSYQFGRNCSKRDIFDLVGNTVVVPVVEFVARNLLDALQG